MRFICQASPLALNVLYRGGDQEAGAPAPVEVTVSDRAEALP